MSAQILRQFVSKFFNIRPQIVKLSGEISPKTILTGNTCWSDRSDETRYQLWGFDAQQGFIDLNQYVGNWSNGEDGRQTGSDGTPLHEIPNVDTYLFFIINEEYSSGNGNDNDYDEWTLQKAPDFQQYWDKINQEDIERWSNWLSDTGDTHSQYQDDPFSVDFNISGSSAYTLSEGDIGVHDDTGWTVEGKVHEDYYTWVNEFKASHPKFGLVWGDFEKSVMAYSKEGYEDFIKSHPPVSWDYGDI